MTFLFEGGQGAADTLRFIEEKAVAGLWRLDLRTSAMEWSAGMFELLGLEADQVRPSYGLITSLIHPDDRSIAHEIDQAVRAGVPFDRVFRIIRHNGRMRWLNNRGETLFDAAGRPERAIGLVQDVTSHRETVQSLRMCGERYRSLVLAADAMVWTARSDGSVTDLSRPGPSSQTLIQYTGDRWQDLVHPEDLAGTMGAWTSAVTAQTPYSHEHRLRAPNGSYRWYRSRAVPVMKTREAIHEWIGISIDIHEQRRWPTLADRRSGLTGSQIRAGRGMLKWSVRDLAEKTGISSGVIRRIEEQDGQLDLPDDMREAIHATFTAAGIEFLVPPDGKPAVRQS